MGSIGWALKKDPQNKVNGLLASSTKKRPNLVTSSRATFVEA